MKNKMKAMTLTLCAALSLSPCSIVSAQENEGIEKDKTETEIVYVFQDAKGEVSKVLVSDWENNPEGEDHYEQYSCEKTLPVKISISYQLDGEEIEPENLAGKSGHIVIRYDFENTQNTGDGEETVYVPFTSLTAMLFENEKFSNVEVTNGKIFNDGDRTIALGFAFPGMAENLNLDTEECPIPDSVVVEADVTDFSMEMSLTYVSDVLAEKLASQLLGQDGGEGLLNQIEEEAEELTESVIALSDGITELSTGLNTLSSNSTALTCGAADVFQVFLDTANEQLSETGMELPELTIENYDEVLTGILNELNPENIETQVTALVTEGIREQVTEQVISAASGLSGADYEAACAAGMITEEQQTQIGETIQNMMENDETVKAQIEAVTAEKMADEEVQGKIAAASAGYEKITALKESLDSYHTFYQGLLDYTAGVDTASEGAAKICEGIGSFTQNASGSLPDGTIPENTGLEKLTDGFQKLETILKAADTYTGYSDDQEGRKGEVHFLYRTAEIG